MNVPLTKQHL